MADIRAHSYNFKEDRLETSCWFVDPFNFPVVTGANKTSASNHNSKPRKQIGQRPSLMWNPSSEEFVEFTHRTNTKEW